MVLGAAGFSTMATAVESTPQSTTVLDASSANDFTLVLLVLTGHIVNKETCQEWSRDTKIAEADIIFSNDTTICRQTADMINIYRRPLTLSSYFRDRSFGTHDKCFISALKFLETHLESRGFTFTTNDSQLETTTAFGHRVFSCLQMIVSASQSRNKPDHYGRRKVLLVCQTNFADGFHSYLKNTFLADGQIQEQAQYSPLVARLYSFRFNCNDSSYFYSMSLRREIGFSQLLTSSNEHCKDEYDVPY